MRNEKLPAVYIIASKRNGTIYIGVTSALWDRISQHKAKSLQGFSSKYGITLLV
jgi:putative endonuclease